MLPMFPTALGLPAPVVDACPLIPSLEKTLEEIMALAESGIRYTQMPHIMEVNDPAVQLVVLSNTDHYCCAQCVCMYICMQDRYYKHTVYNLGLD